MPQDILRLRNMRFFAYHGLFPEENVLGQHFEVDLDLYGDFAAATRSDDVELTCGGVTMTGAGDEPVVGDLDDSAAEGTLLGKRYVDDDGIMEVLCTKPGDGSLGAGGTLLQLKETKPLPASD